MLEKTCLGNLVFTSVPFVTVAVSRVYKIIIITGVICLWMMICV